MKAAPFEYVRADSVDHALAQLAAHGGDAKLIAGGQSLVPMMAMRLARPAPAGATIDALPMTPQAIWRALQAAAAKSKQ